MRKTREILRLKWDLRRSHREVARSLRISCGAVAGTVRRAQQAGLDWSAVAALSDEQLEARLYSAEGSAAAGRQRPVPDCAVIDLELCIPKTAFAALRDA